LLSYDEDLTGLSDQAIVETAQRYRSGGIPEQSDTYAPSIAQFRKAAERQEKFIAIRGRQRLPAPAEYRRTGPAPYEITRQKARERYAGRPILFEDVSWDQFRALNVQGKIPLGSNWVACLATVYGPAPKARDEEQAA
jgi:hypothetical protein